MALKKHLCPLRLASQPVGGAEGIRNGVLEIKSIGVGEQKPQRRKSPQSPRSVLASYRRECSSQVECHLMPSPEAQVQGALNIPRAFRPLGPALSCFLLPSSQALPSPLGKYKPIHVRQPIKPCKCGADRPTHKVCGPGRTGRMCTGVLPMKFSVSDNYKRGIS